MLMCRGDENKIIKTFIDKQTIVPTERPSFASKMIYYLDSCYSDLLMR